MSNVNDLTVNTDYSTLLNAIVSQATGQNLANISTTDVISIAQTSLKTGYDPMLNAISQVLFKTIFSIRPYEAKLQGLRVDNQKYGNHIRKLQVADSTFEDDERYNLTDGGSVDPFVIKKPEVLQTNFYGQNSYQRHYTLFRDQLDTAFSNENEFSQFVTMLVTNISDQITQADEEQARLILADLVAGISASNTAGVRGNESVVHLLSEYNAFTGQTYTATTIREPETYIAFIRWVYARLKTLSNYMTERTNLYQTNITDFNLNRHTPTSRQKFYMFAPEMNNITASVLSDLYNESMLKFADHENITYWQAITSPQDINITTNYMLANGSYTSADVELSNVFGVIFDEEAAGFTRVNEWSAPSPFNARGGYTTFWYHWNNRLWKDDTEKSLILLMD